LDVANLKALMHSDTGVALKAEMPLLRIMVAKWVEAILSSGSPHLQQILQTSLNRQLKAQLKPEER
jgi:hypothetical protein